MMKSDVLDDFDVIKACWLQNKREETDCFPYEIENDIEPIYVAELVEKICSKCEESHFPTKFNAYLDFLEDNCSYQNCFIWS